MTKHVVFYIPLINYCFMTDISRTALLVGASGLVGSFLLPRLLDNELYTKVIIFVRKSLGITHPKLQEMQIDFDQIASIEVKTPVTDVFCTLGTTRGKAKSADNFRKVDFTYVVELAKWAKIHQVQRFVVISAMGAKASSKTLYMGTKGQMEEAVKSVGLPFLGIMHPSLLVGNRKERRIGEWIAGHITLKVIGLFLPLKYRTVSAEKVAIAMLEVAKVNSEGFQLLESDQIHKLAEKKQKEESLK